LALISVLWLPAWVCAQILRLTHSQGAMLLTIGILGGLFAVGMWVWMGDPQTWWRAWLGKVLAHQGRSELSAEVVDRTAWVMNGLMAAAISLSLTITMLIARWWQAMLYNPGGFRAEFQALRLPRGLGIPVAIAAVWVVIEQANGSNYAMITDLVLVASVLYFFQGLAVIHYRVRGQSTVWTVILYALLLLLPHYTYLSLAMAGLADSFVNFRALNYSDSSS
jgi:hypothetical protein